MCSTEDLNRRMVMATQTGGLGEALLELEHLRLRRAELVQQLEGINRSSMFIDIIKDGYKRNRFIYYFTKKDP
jgi:hypothetical protein